MPIMQWTLLKHIVSERVCKWNRPIQEAGENSPEGKEKNTILELLPDRILLWFMGGLLLLASVRSLFQPSEVLVAWGNDGSLPAVCYSSSPSPGSRRYTVLCPGGGNAASQMLAVLDKCGCGRLESVFSSTSAPSFRGTRVLLKNKPTAGLVLFADARRRTPDSGLPAEARSAGLAVQELSAVSGVEPSRHQHWEFRSWRGKNGDMHWSFYHLKDQVKITLFWQKNGMLELQCQDRYGTRITKQFPRSNRCGYWQTYLADK